MRIVIHAYLDENETVASVSVNLPDGSDVTLDQSMNRADCLVPDGARITVSETPPDPAP